MLSADFWKLWDHGVIQLGIWETIYMTLLSTVIAYIIGLPIGIVLSITDKDGIHPIPWLNKLLGIVVNILRSIPFVILMVALLPAAKLVVGTSIGNRALIFALVVAAAPYIARMVESSIKEVDKGVIEAAQAMGTSNFKIVTKVLIPEAKPALIVGAVISTVTVLGYSAMGGIMGAGGLGKLATVNGYQRSLYDIVWVCVVLTVLIVEIIQEIGMKLAVKTDKRIR